VLSNLPFGVDSETIKNIFSEYGVIQKVHLITNRETMQNTGFGFIQFTSEDEARRVIEELPTVEILGRQVRSRESRPRGRS